LNERLGKPYMPAITADFQGVVKGLKSLDSMKDKVATELARCKIAANEAADRIQANLATLRELASEHAFLFADTAQLVAKANDDLTALVKSRIADHKAAEAAKEEATRERIRKEEQERVEREHVAKVESERIQREQAEQAQAARIRDEQAAAAEAERKRAAAAEPAPAPVAQPTAAPAVPFEAVVAMMPASVRQAMAPADSMPVNTDEDNGERLTLTQINALLAPIQLSATGLAELGFPHVATDKSAKLYRECDLVPMCRAIHKHASNVAAKRREAVPA